MKKKVQYVDKSYKLTRNAAPLSYTLPSRNTKRFTLMHFDEETGINRELRYARNQKSPFVDEQDGNAILEPVVFVDGFLHVPKQNQVLQQFLHYHPMNGRKFVEVDKAKDAEAQVDRLLVEADALVEAKTLSLEQLETVSRVLFGDISKKSTAELKRDILVFAKNNPSDLLEVLRDPDLQLMGTVQGFFDAGLLTFRKSKKEVWYNTPTNKTKLLNVPFGQDGVDLTVSYMRTDDGIEVLKYLESLLD